MLIGQSMREVFRESLTTTLQKMRLSLTDTAQAYVVQLLAEFSRSDAAFAGVDDRRPRLFDAIARASEADRHEAARIYKHLGDSSLVMGGFLADPSLSRSEYCNLGMQGYSGASSALRASTASVLFDELAAHFASIMTLLERMGVGIGLAPQTDEPEAIVALLDRYERATTEAGRAEIRDALLALGVKLASDAVEN
jgi:hypothetical protein